MLSVQPPTSACRPAPATPPPRYDGHATRELGALRDLRRTLDAEDPRVVREAAALVSSQLFFAPLLAEARKLPFGRELGHGGRMEEAFGEQLDQHIADAVARRDQGLTAQLAGRLASRRGLQPGQPPAGQDASQPAELEPRRPTRGGDS
jgi:hypothetical protein